MIDYIFGKKSIYQGKYHYEKKVNQVSKRINLTDEQKYELYNKLMEIDNNVMEILNKKYCRKRMISIFYLIKKLLEEMGCEKSKLVYLKISPQTLENYEKWWNSYISLKNDWIKYMDSETRCNSFQFIKYPKMEIFEDLYFDVRLVLKKYEVYQCLKK